MSGSETDQMASLRCLLQGTRTVVCASYDDVITTMQSMGIAKSKCDPRSAWHFFMNMDQASVKKLVETGPLYHVTQGAGDAIYLPAGYVFAEKISAKEDCLGCVARFLVTHENDPGVRDRLKAVQQSIIDSGFDLKDSLKNVIDFYSS